LISLEILDLNFDMCKLYHVLGGPGNNLEILILRNFYFNDWLGGGTINLDNLREFSAEGSFSSSRAFYRILGHILAPKLRRLTILPRWEFDRGLIPENDHSIIANGLLSLIQGARNLEEIRFGGNTGITSITLETLKNACEHTKGLRQMMVAVSNERHIQTLVEFLRSRQDDSQLSAISELDILLPPSHDNLLSDEAHVRETFRLEVERLTVKRVPLKAVERTVLDQQCFTVAG